MADTDLLTLFIIEVYAGSIVIEYELCWKDNELLQEAISNINAAVGTTIVITIGGQQLSYLVLSNEPIIIDSDE